MADAPSDGGQQGEREKVQQPEQGGQGEAVEVTQHGWSGVRTGLWLICQLAAKVGLALGAVFQVSYPSVRKGTILGRYAARAK